MWQAIYILLSVGALIGISIGQGEYPQCPPEGTVNLAHPNCSIFIICIEGRGTEVVCSRGLYYNPATTLCDFPDNVPECIEGTRAPLPGTTTQIPTTITTTTQRPATTTTTQRSTSTTTQTSSSSAKPTTRPPTEEPTLEP